MKKEDINDSTMSDEFKDIYKKNKYKDYIIIGILYVIVIVLAVLLVLGIKNQKKTVEDSINKTMTNNNLSHIYN